LRFLGIILRVLRPEVSVIDVYITNYSFKSLWLKGGGRETLKTFVPIILPRILLQVSKFKINKKEISQDYPFKS
jgi:hypothetical protein